MAVYDFEIKLYFESFFVQVSLSISKELSNCSKRVGQALNKSVLHCLESFFENWLVVNQLIINLIYISTCSCANIEHTIISW